MGGRLMLSTWNEANRVGHRGQDKVTSIVYLRYLLGNG